MLSTHCFKATVPSIRFFNWQKIGLIVSPINWQLTLTGEKIRMKIIKDNYMESHSKHLSLTGNSNLSLKNGLIFSDCDLKDTGHPLNV